MEAMPCVSGCQQWRALSCRGSSHGPSAWVVLALQNSVPGVDLPSPACHAGDEPPDTSTPCAERGMSASDPNPLPHTPGPAGPGLPWLIGGWRVAAGRRTAPPLRDLVEARSRCTHSCSTAAETVSPFGHGCDPEPPLWGAACNPNFRVTCSPQTVLRIVVLGIWDYIENKIEVKTNIHLPLPPTLGPGMLPSPEPGPGARERGCPFPHADKGPQCGARGEGRLRTFPVKGRLNILVKCCRIVTYP